MNTQSFSQIGEIIDLCCEYLSVRCIWLYLSIMSRMSFRVNPHSIVCLNYREILARRRRHISSWSESNGIRIYNYLVCKRTLNHLGNRSNDWGVLWVLICMVPLILSYCQVTYESESTLYSLTECQGSPCSK